MKTRKQIWIAALCLLSATVLTLSLRTPATHVLAAQYSLRGASLAHPPAYVASASARAAAISRALLSDDAGLAQRVSPTLPANPYLPIAQEFTLTPPNPDLGITKTTLAVRFPESPAEKLASQFPVMLRNQRVVMQRSADDPSVFSTQLDFDWHGFVQEQQRRKELANLGKLVPVYKGRDFVRMEKMQFLDPTQIKVALQSHQPIHFSPEIIAGGDGTTVIPDHMLMIIDKHVVEDSDGILGRTYDACLSPGNQGNPQGAWAFRTLWMAAVNTTSVETAELALQSFLANWQQNVTINTNFTVLARPGMGQLGQNGLLDFWPIDSSTNLPSLLAPVRLNAIVNRIDLANQPNETQNGELRFVFGLTASAESNQACVNQGPLFNIIFEYQVPAAITNWASQWTSLPDDLNFGSQYLIDLQAITDQVVKPNDCTNSNGGSISCLEHIRTNEIDLAQEPNLIWEQREFYIKTYGSPNVIAEKTVSQTPDGSFNISGQPQCQGNEQPPICDPSNPPTLATYINDNAVLIFQTLGTELVPGQFPGITPFLGGSAFNGFNLVNADGYWNAPQIPPVNFEARRYFSLNACQGCHGAETNNNGFQQVFNRAAGSPSTLSNFLLGCAPSQSSCASGNPGPEGCPRGQCQLNTPGQESVLDPANSSNGSHAYGDIVRRMLNLQNLASPTGLLQPFILPRIGSVH